MIGIVKEEEQLTDYVVDSVVVSLKGAMSSDVLNEEERLMSSIHIARSYLYYLLEPFTSPHVKVSRKYQDIHSSLIVRLTPLTHSISCFQYYYMCAPRYNLSMSYRY